MVKLKSKSNTVHSSVSSSDGSAGSKVESMREELATKQLELELKLVDRQQQLVNQATESITLFGNSTLNTETPGFGNDGITDGGFLVSGDGQTKKVSEFAYTNEEELNQIRSKSRYLSTHNEFAIGGLSNIINYTIGGFGLQWRVQTRKGARKLTESEIEKVQLLIDTFHKVNKWPQYEREYVTRVIRDGEVFTRFFSPDKMDRSTLVRFIEPGMITSPAGSEFTFGIETLPGDIETIINYYKNGKEKIPEKDVIHSKAFVDRNSKRGLPGFYPVETNLNRAEKLLRNMSAVAAIQAAIALVRKHNNYSRGSVSGFVDEQKDFQSVNTLTGRTERYQQLGPAEIIDAPKGMDYDFPAAQSNAGNFVTILQAELRAVAARFNMPEFMFTQDASNNNFASTLVAEGPAVKSFESWQGFFVTELKQIMHRMLDIEVLKGTISEDINSRVSFQVTAPKIEVRDRLKLAQAYQLENQAGVLSPQTWSEQLGLDYENEQVNLDNHSDRLGTDRMPSNTLPLPPGDEDDEGDD